jgi:hypothetical protein
MTDMKVIPVAPKTEKKKLSELEPA